ncbi:hypothetical protein ACFLQU_05830, partial [Verrucomicrobiota bacterium]
VKKRQLIPDYLVEGKTYELMLERFDAHKELSGEGQISPDPRKINLDWLQFVDIGPPRPKPKPPPKPKVKPPPKPKIELPGVDDGDDDDDLDLDP